MKNPSKNHLIIFRFIDTEQNSVKNDKRFFPREMLLAGKLLKKYPFEFLINLKEPFYPLKMQSLAWFIGKDGKIFLNNEYFEHNKSITNLTFKKPELKLEEKPIGDNLKIEQKPKSLNDFLNLFKKETI